MTDGGWENFKGKDLFFWLPAWCSSPQGQVSGGLSGGKLEASPARPLPHYPGIEEVSGCPLHPS